jgi:hypothetical protein
VGCGVNFYRSSQIWAVRAIGWQLDWRKTPWEPFSVRVLGHKPTWHTLRLGRFGRITLGRIREIAPGEGQT